MESISLTLSLLVAGLSLGLFISIAVACILSGICEALQQGSSQHKVGLLMVMVYVPLFIFLMRNMGEVLPMVIGVIISSTLTSIAVMIKQYRETLIKNPPSLPRAG